MRFLGVMAMVRVEDIERALRFYRDILGFTVHDEREEWVFFQEGVGLQRAPEPLTEVDFNINAVVVTLFVEDVLQTFAELTAKGVAFFLPPTHESGVTVATFRDTENNVLQLLQSS